MNLLLLSGHEGSTRDGERTLDLLPLQGPRWRAQTDQLFNPELTSKTLSRFQSCIGTSEENPDEFDLSTLDSRNSPQTA
jgi:hypothetical protein